MSNAQIQVPAPINEPVLSYAPGSPEKKALKAEIAKQKAKRIEIPVVIGGREVTDRKQTEVRCPHDHRHVLATVAMANESDIKEAIASAEKARREWAALPWHQRAAVFLKAADLLADRYRPVLNAGTMLGQSKTAFQAEIDAACELIDFWRFNAKFMEQIYADQPLSPRGQWNRVEGRGLEGFVFAITPFNFTSIALNLPTAPALMGCSVLWKPAHTSMLSSYLGYQLLREAGLPDGVINFVPGESRVIGDAVIAHQNLSGIHFTGSTGVFNHLWSSVGKNIATYKQYPRVVGETGGKDFIFAHKSADRATLVCALVRGAFEYQGQKCSAASRAYIPESVWSDIENDLMETTNNLKMGDPENFTNFMAAVIDKKSFDNIKGYIEHAKADPNCRILAGGEYDDKIGYFVRPTIIVAKDPKYRSMCEEIFGPVLTIHVYKDNDFEKALDLCDTSSPYALTGAIFAQDRQVVEKMTIALQNAAGNFYVNDKPTGAVVGQQPFGGARASGTNDKAGSKLNLIRWMSQRTIKETFVPPTTIAYPHMAES